MEDKIRYIAREHEFATSGEIACALQTSRQIVAAVLGRSISERDHAEHARRGHEIDWAMVTIIRRRLAYRAERSAA
jgi:hypothetical protein